MLTKKGKYGLKALVHLARLPAGQLAFVNDIATGNNIPKKFLDAILGELRNAGFVDVSLEPTRVYRYEDAEAFLKDHGLPADAIGRDIDGKFISAFVRATKPAKQ